MKVSAWIDYLENSIDKHGDRELKDMPSSWLSDAIPDEICRWLLVNRWLEFTLLPEGIFVPGVIGEDPENDELEIGVKLEDAVARLAIDRTDGELIITALERAIVSAKTVMESSE